MLAAGHSRRFGAADKLLALYEGRPLVTYAADALKSADVNSMIAVASSATVADKIDGFETVFVTKPQHTQSDSLRTGLARAQEMSADRVLVVLGDMPLIGPEVLNAVLERAGPTGMSAVTDGYKRLPPACFPKQVFPELFSLSGDAGARGILARIPEAALVAVTAEQVSDVDTPEDLTRL